MENIKGVDYSSVALEYPEKENKRENLKKQSQEVAAITAQTHKLVREAVDSFVGKHPEEPNSDTKVTPTCLYEVLNDNLESIAKYCRSIQNELARL